MGTESDVQNREGRRAPQQDDQPSILDEITGYLRSRRRTITREKLDKLLDKLYDEARSELQHAPVSAGTVVACARRLGVYYAGCRVVQPRSACLAREDFLRLLEAFGQLERAGNTVEHSKQWLMLHLALAVADYQGGKRSALRSLARVILRPWISRCTTWKDIEHYQEFLQAILAYYHYYSGEE